MMQLKINNLKNISLSVLLLFTVVATVAQENKIDGVAVVIGKNIVLDSDIAKFKQELELRTEGKVKISDCEMLEQLMQQKLLAHHAIIDSVVVSESEVMSRVDRTIAFFKNEYGTIEKVVEVYGFNNLSDLKRELAKVQKENLLIEKEQQKITSKTTITPEEVRVYYKGLKEKNELPKIPAEIELAQIVLKATATKEEEARVINKLKEIKQQVIDGASFKLKAIINSEDPGVSQNSGEYTITKDSPFVKEFKETAFSLEKDEISEPFKTNFGYHIVKLNQVKGNQRVVSHILMRPQVSDLKLEQTKNQIKKLREDLVNNKITFKNAVKKYSEDEDTRFSDGLIVNPYTGDSKFDLTRMDPAMYARVSDLQKGQMTEVFYDENRGGEKMYKIILMKDRTNTHTADLVKDYVKIQQFALTKKKEETIEKWTKNKIEETYIKLGNEYKKCDFKENWKGETSK